MASVVSSTLPARRRLIRGVRLKTDSNTKCPMKTEDKVAYGVFGVGLLVALSLTIYVTNRRTQQNTEPPLAEEISPQRPGNKQPETTRQAAPMPSAARAPAHEAIAKAVPSPAEPTVNQPPLPPPSTSAPFDSLRGLEGWQTNGIAFAHLFFGADLEKRDSGPEIIKKTEVREAIEGKMVVWPALISSNLLGNNKRRVIAIPFSASGTIIIAAGSRQDGDKILAMDEMIKDYADSANVAVSFTLSPSEFDGQGLTAMINKDGFPIITLLAKNLSVVPVAPLHKQNISPIVGWPPFSSALTGTCEVKVSNPNAFAVKVGLRSEGKGQDFTVAPQMSGSALVPDGTYEIYFQYSSDPTGIYNGDTFTLNGNSVEIRIVEVVGGNYGIRKVK